MKALFSNTSNIRANLIIQAYSKWLTKQSKVIDIGTGHGVVANKIKTFFNVKLYACDIDNYTQFKVPFKKIKSNKLPYKDKEFEYAMLNDVLHHMPLLTQESIIIEAKRIAKKVLIFEVEPTLSGYLFDYIINKIHHWNMPIPLTFRKEKNWVKLFKIHNLKTKIKRISSPFYYPFRHIAILID
jgi:ubiquinone/menaquinone biosynthesis C-methylase UbiE